MPDGTFTGTAHGTRYIATKSSAAGGRSQSLVAEQLGGPDYISANLFWLTPPLLKPCEMPAEKVIAFVLDLTPEINTRGAS